MGLVRDHLREARREYAAVRYPDDLAAEVLARPRRWLWRAAVAGSALGGLAAAFVLVILLEKASQPGPGATAAVASAAQVRHVAPTVPSLPAGVDLVPVAAPLVPPAFPSFNIAAPPTVTATPAEPAVARKTPSADREQT